DKDALQQILPVIASATVLQDQPDTFTILTATTASVSPATATNNTGLARHLQEVKLSFFGGLGFGRIGEPELAIPGDVQVASLNDLLAHKLKVVLQRVEAKDYLDIATLISAGIPLNIGLAGARTLFGTNFQPSECLKALVYFEGGDLESLSDQTRAT